MHIPSSRPVVDVIIPALNEEQAIGRVIRDIPSTLVRHVFVADNGSTDRTAQVATEAGARVLPSPLRGYGSACLTAIREIKSMPADEHPDAVAFLDGDYSDHPEELAMLMQPLERGYDLVVGSRTRGGASKGSLTPQQRFGNWLATRMIRWIYGYNFTDLGPFRLIRWEALQSLGMRDPNYGWTVEMQVKALKQGLRCTEVPVSYRPRIGRSKVSGTVKGSVLAGYKIIRTILQLA